MTDPLAVLETLLGHAGHHVTAQKFVSSDRLRVLIDAGWLVPAGMPSAVLCEDCGDAHTVDVIWIDGQQQGVCGRTGEKFPISPASLLYRINVKAFAGSLAQVLQLKGGIRPLLAASTVWRLGGRRIDDMHSTFFFTPKLDRVDSASAVLEAVAQQARATAGVLIVADDIDAVRLLARRNVVIQLRDLVALELDGTLAVDDARLRSLVFPNAPRPRGRGRPAEQRDLILPILDALEHEGCVVDDSNETCRLVRDKFKKWHPGAKVPVDTTIKSAVAGWLAKRE